MANLPPSAFRFDISFLRVVAVIAVVFYHFNFRYFGGGFVGVDVFFVISGYLMTKIILGAFGKNNFSVWDFYKKRVVRIIPALLVVILCFLFIVYFFVPPQFVAYLKSAFSSSLFFSNYYYFNNSGYFDGVSHQNFLLHTWSLSVEWQFYMLFPLLLLPLKKAYLKSQQNVLIYFSALIVLSFALMLYHNESKQSFSFYNTYTRSWEMLFGGIAFLVEPKLKNVNAKIKVFFIGLSYACIGYFTIKANAYNWPSWSTLGPVLATAMIIALSYEFKFYANKILKYIGDLSYSLYLYHWPVYVLSLFYGLNLRWQDRLIFIVVSFILAILSYQFVEKRNYTKVYQYVILCSGLFFASFMVLSKIDTRKIMPAELANLAFATSNYKYSEQAKAQYHFNTRHYSGVPLFEKLDKNYLTIRVNNKKTVLLLGDSHAGMFAQTIDSICQTNKFNFIQATVDGTFPMKNSKTEIPEGVNFFNYVFEEYLPKNKNKVDLVVVNANYSAYAKDVLKQYLDTLLVYLKENKINYLFLGQTPTFVMEFPTTYYMDKYRKIKYSDWDIKEQNNQEVNQYNINLLGNRYIDLLNAPINRISKDYMPFVYDRNHLTNFGAGQYQVLIEKVILLHIDNR